MSKITYYSKSDDDELCYDIDHWYQYLEDEEINSIELIEMEDDKDSGMRFCTLEQEPIDGGVCGKANCGEDYIPQNGARGKCVYQSFTLKATEKRKTITTDTEFEKQNKELHYD